MYLSHLNDIIKYMENDKIILIVEDEKSLREALNDKLTREGFTVFEAKDGEEGLEMSRKVRPGLILLDLLMPKMSGTEMAKKLREEEWGKNVKIIILTNLTEEEKVKRELENSVYEYIIKNDVRIDQVVEKVKRILEC
ncbi:MAG: PAS/PAC sensor hybrid histidine kinase [Candidatus Nomurabacteria bacterium GW2011_GWB1_40_7]|uniref:PAS/PAC sensor hybrid histidine kinase n=1 Tax=Candidatus Nomurabacteria bacterium GW2011_GWB1_40_7 TaxID=1618744 RepID=A0A0G0W608_9BACT|nr:MAG: PAS/PAC sensor hybrid histidine kinase [Candidatus Nomurabacteria bacterium GW2011_GWB1_40_7]